jgi:hypothetical protein
MGSTFAAKRSPRLLPDVSGRRWARGYFGGVGLLVAGVGLLVGGVGLLVAGVGLLVAGVGLLVAGVGLLVGGLFPCLVSRFS